ncbi:hypothetical protein [Niabella ginsengisoli]|uniref:IgGFc-binding protein N-terminal domain-containing protein n=1 Tax=Niabella ginsengisoli TaxID=522298 RepID=A0ABS9SQI3_9BACT|nr:hypothetical protein [Niabella ginsengisoli]MCH5600627.1 hypothetical protein [Niabella ginsengisoli]
MNIVGNSPNNRNVRMQLNNVEVFNNALNRFEYAKLTANLPTSNLTGTTESITVTNTSTTANNRIKIGLIELTYPRAFNFGGANNFRFTLSGSASQGKYLEISGFTYSGIPVLYDLTSGRRYEANVSNPSLIKIYVQPSTTSHDVVLVNTATANIKTIAGLESRNFINYSLQENQGNYLIVTHPAIINGANGAQPVEEYRAYRSSAQGGGYNAKVYLIDQLTDQFAFGIKHNPLAVRNFCAWLGVSFRLL